eukprot:867955-Prorocentrum_lima.AAC.1
MKRWVSGERWPTSSWPASHVIGQARQCLFAVARVIVQIGAPPWTRRSHTWTRSFCCLLYTSDAADDM